MRINYENQSNISALKPSFESRTSKINSFKLAELARQGMCAKEIADIFHTCPSNIHYRARLLGIKLTPPSKPKKITIEQKNELESYIKKGIRAKEIAKIFGVCVDYIYKKSDYFEISSRPRKCAKDINWAKLSQKISHLIKQGYHQSEIANILNIPAYTIPKCLTYTMKKSFYDIRNAEIYRLYLLGSSKEELAEKFNKNISCIISILQKFTQNKS